MNMFSTIKNKFFKQKQASHMDLFSIEYRDKLIAEHKLVSASIVHLTGSQWQRFARSHTVGVVNMSVANLQAQKVELEVKIDVLNEYLN